MFGISSIELLMILLIGVVVLGPERLPQVIRTVTKWMSKIRRFSTELQRTINLEAHLLEHNSLKKQAEKELFGDKPKKKKKKAPTPETEAKADTTTAPESAEAESVADAPASTAPAAGQEVNSEEPPATPAPATEQKIDSEVSPDISAPAQDTSGTAEEKKHE